MAATAMYKDIVFKNTTDAPVKPDPGAMDLSIDDASSSPGPGGSRRAGNLWTAEARDDMYQRRENGESWEDICKDYPRRSRHAMQQQYSMMKKQKAIANGTWTTNRRGRKRRNPMPETWPSKPRRPDTWNGPEGEADATEDDLAEFGSEDMEDAEESEVFHDDLGPNGRQPGLLRSVTEPAIGANKQLKMVAFSAQQGQNPSSTGSNGTTPPNAQATSAYPPPPPAYNGSSAPRKRRRLSQDIDATPSTPVPSTYGSSFVPAGIMLEKEDLLQLLEKGSQRARVANRILREEREAERAAFEASLTRATRRASEAQERFSMATYEHGDNMKMARVEFSDTLKAKARDKEAALEKQRKEFQAEMDNWIVNVESLTKQNDNLKKENDAYREGRPDREKELEQEVEALTKRTRLLEENLTTTTRELKEKLIALEAAAQERSKADATAQTSPLTASSDWRNRDRDELINKLQALSKPAAAASDVVLDAFTKLSSKIANLNGGVEELGHKAIVQSIQEIMDERGAFEGKLAVLKPPFNQLTTALSSLPESFKNSPVEQDTAMQEAPRTPPAEKAPLPKAEAKAESNGINAYPHLPQRVSVPDPTK